MDISLCLKCSITGTEKPCRFKAAYCEKKIIWSGSSSFRIVLNKLPGVYHSNSLMQGASSWHRRATVDSFDGTLSAVKASEWVVFQEDNSRLHREIFLISPKTM